ncbi:MAG: hypothetical protein U9O64_06880 [Campylobacterota bacterium]|nr:hypothetical protein [Campylobacterota bacterium]
MVVVSAHAFAVEGAVTQVRVDASGAIYITVGTSFKPLVGTADAIKSMYAAALTAKSTGDTVSAAAGSYDGSAIGWTRFVIK